MFVAFLAGIKFSGNLNQDGCAVLTRPCVAHSGGRCGVLGSIRHRRDTPRFRGATLMHRPCAARDAPSAPSQCARSLAWRAVAPMHVVRECAPRLSCTHYLPHSPLPHLSALLGLLIAILPRATQDAGQRRGRRRAWRASGRRQGPERRWRRRPGRRWWDWRGNGRAGMGWQWPGSWQHRWHARDV